MKVLLTGANGFIGSEISKALRAQGHEVCAAVRTLRQAGDCVVNLETDTQAHTWLPRLQGVGAVVNAVGLLGGSEARMMAVHAHAPTALAQACAQSGIRRFVQVSALGVDSGLPTLYYRSKLAGEEGIRAALPGAHIIRPSLVFGLQGDSSRMFMQLTRLPLLMLPKAGRIEVQPVHVKDVVQAVLTLLQQAPPASNQALPQTGSATDSTTQASTGQTIAALGPQAMNLADYLASLATQLGRKPPRIWPLPLALAQSSAWLMQALPQVVWTPDTLRMLLAGSQGDPAAFAALLGRSPIDVASFLASS